jgi:uncharacterized coiled-coil DUF342 family protein
MDPSQMAEKIAELERELAERPSRQELNSKVDELQATKQQLRKVELDLLEEMFQQRQPSPREDVALKMQIQSLEARMEQKNASIKALKGDRNQLRYKIEDMLEDQVRESVRQKRWDQHQEREKEWLRASAKAADVHAQSARAEVTKSEDSAIKRIRGLHESMKLLQAQLAVARSQLQVTKVENEQLTARCKDLEKRLEDATGGVEDSE